jgi:hypothetical protein
VFEDFLEGRIGVVICRVEIHQRAASAPVPLPEARHLEPAKRVADDRDPVKAKGIEHRDDVLDVLIEVAWTLHRRAAVAASSDSDDSVAVREPWGEVVEVMWRAVTAARQEYDRRTGSSPIEHFQGNTLPHRDLEYRGRSLGWKPST